LFGQNDLTSGLYFASHEVHQDQRTSLHLSPVKPFKFPDGFALEFDINFRQGDGYYGYIFRIIGDRDANIDLVSNLSTSTSDIWLVYKEEILFTVSRDEFPDVDYDRWIGIKIELDVRAARIVLSINGKKQVIPVEELRMQEWFDIFFGTCRLNDFYNTDVCPMSIKDIRIYTPGDQLYRRWELRKHSNDKVYDDVAYAEATAENPVWLINKYTDWRKLADLRIDNLHGITPDSVNEKIFFVSDKAVYSLTLESLRMDTIAYRRGAPHPVMAEQNVIYNAYTDEIWSYDFANPTLSRFNFATRTWSYTPVAATETEYSHHNAFISPVDSSLTTLFGYGFYTYKSTINTYNPLENQWSQESAGINPRYLSAAGRMNSRQALIFGGYGSKSGRQELSPGVYYDLHLFDFNDRSFTHLWTLPAQSPPFVPAATLVFDEQTNRFYTLTFNNGSHNASFRLTEMEIDKPAIRFVGDPIPFLFRDTETWLYLYLNRAKTDLIAIVSHNHDVALYAITYRPLAKEDVFQEAPPLYPFSRWWPAIPAALLLGILLFVSLKAIGRLRPKTYRRHLSLAPFPASDRAQTSAVYILGNFQVFDTQGKNITHSFSPTLKQLFLFVMFNSSKKSKGVTSEKIDKILWHDKIGDSARNNRNVNISKLRAALELVGDIEITNKNAMWQIVTGPNTFFDYPETLALLTRAKRGLLDEDGIYRLLELLGTGDLLPGMQAAWLAPFKDAYTKEVTDVLSTLLSQSAAYSDSLRYYIADHLLSTDTLNEDAIHEKCALLSRMGKRREAKTVYDAFVKDYEQFTGTVCPISFHSLIDTLPHPTVKSSPLIKY
jgi:DNA-binding SARP family transcriptional activator